MRGKCSACGKPAGGEKKLKVLFEGGGLTAACRVLGAQHPYGMTGCVRAALGLLQQKVIAWDEGGKLRNGIHTWLLQ